MALCREAWPVNLLPSKDRLPRLDHTRLSRQLQHLHEQRTQKMQVFLAEVADGAEVGAVVADDGQEGEVAFAGLGDLAAGIDADAIGVEQQTNEHRGVEGRLAARLHFVGGVEGVQIELTIRYPGGRRRGHFRASRSVGLKACWAYASGSQGRYFLRRGMTMTRPIHTRTGRGLSQRRTPSSSCSEVVQS